MHLTFLLLLTILPGVAEGQLLHQYDAVVHPVPGVGNYTRIAAAIDAAPTRSLRRYTIKIGQGFYKEYVRIPKEKTNLMLVGDGIRRTVVWGNRSAKAGFKTYETATVGINGAGFAAIDISFVNGAGPEGMQAVALRSDVQSVFYRCQFIGYQDTLYPKLGRQFYRDCQIYGTVDFIFGDATVIFQNCKIYARNPGIGKENTITAQGRTTPNGEGGTVIHNCSIEATRDLQNQTLVKTYLGRPWEIYSRVIIMQSSLGSLIDPRGWLQWPGRNQTNKLFYAEYQNKGLGSVTGHRVKWPGVRVFTNSQDANRFTVRNFLKGNEWIPDGIPYQLDLIQ